MDADRKSGRGGLLRGEEGKMVEREKDTHTESQRRIASMPVGKWQQKYYKKKKKNNRERSRKNNKNNKFRRQHRQIEGNV